MPSTKDKKSKNKLLKIDVSSDSGSDESEHELSYHAKDKVKLMKEVLKLIKPKKIKSMAPDCIKNLDIVDINSMLLEELLGISNKRLQYIFNGENVDRETSSSESEEEKQPIDVISLDDISDDDDIELCASQNEKRSSDIGLGKHKDLRFSKIKTEVVVLDNIKSERVEKSRKDIKKKSKNIKELKNNDTDLKEADKDKLMSVLELLELQARARAIRSQLAIETEKKKEPQSTQGMTIKEEDSDSDAVIIESPQHKEIVITSSDSDEESTTKIPQSEGTSTSGIQQHYKHQPNSESDINPPQKKQRHSPNKNSENKKKKEKLLAKIQKIKLVRHKTVSHNGLSTDIETSNVEPTKDIDQECIIEPSVDDGTITSQICSNINQVNEENVLLNITKTEEISENNDNCKVHNNVNDIESNTNEPTKDTPSILIKDSPKEIHRKIASYCDNDEIVINLDEDEMDDIDND